ncbi:50S ribosomal protein L31e [archaeon SCG-AAA382B04]|nr:50S ribosomal protein L31e [archaeon SCG-AAA382B04]
MGEIMEEKLIKIPLNGVKETSRRLRAKKAINKTKVELKKHLNSSEENIYLDNSINEKIWERGIENPPNEIRVRARRFEDGVVEAEIAED